MELGIVDAANVPKERIISVRFGDVRRQAKLEKLQKHSLKFPSATEANLEPMQIEMLQVVAVAQVVLRPGQADYRVNFPAELGCSDSPGGYPKAESAAGPMALGLRLRRCEAEGAPGGAGGNSGSPAATAAAPEPGGGAVEPADPAAAARDAAKDYLTNHGLLDYLQGMLFTLTKERPSDPYAFMRAQLDTLSPAAPSSGAAAPPTAPPAPTPPQSEGPQVQPASPEGAPLPDSTPAAGNTAAEDLREQVRHQLGEAAASGTLHQLCGELGPQHVEMKLQVCDRLQAACKSGFLEGALSSAIGYPQPSASDGERLAPAPTAAPTAPVESGSPGRVPGPWAGEEAATATAPPAAPQPPRGPPPPRSPAASPPEGEPPRLLVETLPEPAPAAVTSTDEAAHVTREELHGMRGALASLGEDNRLLREQLDHLNARMAGLVKESEEITQLASKNVFADASRMRQRVDALDAELARLRQENVELSAGRGDPLQVPAKA